MLHPLKHPKCVTQRPLWLPVAIALLMSCSIGSADQVILDRNPETSVSLADNVECSACDLSLTPSAIEVLTGETGGEVSAGQLWSFLKAQGVDSIDELTLRLDIDPTQASASSDGPSIDISSFQFQIEDPDGGSGLATDVQIGDKQLLLPFESSSPDSSDMQLAVKLHYDFMERFSADSTEKIKLNVSGSGLMPSISIAQKTETFPELNWSLLIGFSLFWLVIFCVVNWLTKPVTGAAQPGGPVPATKKQIVSA